MTRRLRVSAAALLAIVLAQVLSACTTPSREARLEQVAYQPVKDFDESDPVCRRADGTVTPAPRTYSDVAKPAFAGVLRGLSEDNADGQVRYIFHTHGMGITHACGDFMDPLTAVLAERGYRLDGEPSKWQDPPTRTPHHIRGEALPCKTGQDRKPCLFNTFGEYRIDRFKGPGGDRVVVYSYFWHRDLWRVQLPFVNHDLQQNPGLLAKPAKELVDGGLGDAAAYVGEMGVPLREGMASAICAMIREAATGREARPDSLAGLEKCLTDDEAKRLANADKVQLSFISHSLGSRMLFDVLSTATADRPTATTATETLKAVAGRTNTFFMAANQLPLLGAGRVTRTTTGSSGIQARAECMPLPAFLALRCDLAETKMSLTGERDEPLDVIGFVDPGDLLGFRVSGGIADETYEGIRFVNVSHRNAPQILWLGTWPTSAHDQELSRRSATALILCGGVDAGAGKLEARDCGAPRRH